MKLLDVPAIVRSKNAGPFRITLDVIFKDDEWFNRMKKADVWNRENIAKSYKIDEDMIEECLVYEPARAFKCTLRRRIPSGSFGDTDIYGAQQHIPLYYLDI